MKRKFLRPQRGAATLVVVMVLFIIMALLAAYANRSLMFEQRMAGGYVRAGIAQEMADAGMEWALTMLNGPAVDNNCQPANSPTGRRFADLYIKMNPLDRSMSSVNSSEIIADCTRAGNGWTCRCPAVGARRAPAAMDDGGLAPSFGVLFKVLPLNLKQPLISLYTPGCSHSVIDNCWGPGTDEVLRRSRQSLGYSIPSTQVTLMSAVRSPPSAPLVAKGGISGNGLGLHNTDPRTAGLLYVIGGQAPSLTASRLESLPGTPPELAHVEGDDAMASGDVFRMFMGMERTRYQNHPALHVVTCGGLDCSTALSNAYNQGWRMLWVQGPMTVGSTVTLGSEDDPVVIVANGAVALNGAFQMTGMLTVLGQLNWTNNTASPSVITGAVLAEGNVVTQGAMDIHYRQSVSDQLRNRIGSYVRVAGSWYDVN